MTGEKQTKVRTASPEARRKQLIDATVTSIAKHGISGTTLATVTKLAGLSVGLANFHFKSKDALLEESLRSLAMEHRDHWVKSQQRDGLTAAEKVLAIIDAQFHPSTCSRKKLAVWFAFFGETAYRKFYRVITASIDAERQDTLVALFDEIIAQNDSPLTPEGIALTLESLFDGFWLNMLMYPEKFSRESAKAQIIQYLHTNFPKQSGFDI